jgi:ribosomal protein S18 acetylase RimI-like enzyme
MGGGTGCSGEDEFRSWLDVQIEGVAHPDTQGVPWHEEFPREVIERAERDFAAAVVMRYAALHDGVMAGGASFHLAEGVAQLTGAATAPAHRHRGIQTALLSARLADAAAAGCDIAVVTTARIQIAAERAAPGLRSAVYPHHPGEAALSPQAPPAIEATPRTMRQR